MIHSRQYPETGYLELGNVQLTNIVSKFEGRERRLDIVEFIDVCRAMGVNPLTMLLQAGLISAEDVRSLETPP